MAFVYYLLDIDKSASPSTHATNRQKEAASKHSRRGSLHKDPSIRRSRRRKKHNQADERKTLTPPTFTICRSLSLQPQPLLAPSSPPNTKYRPWHWSIHSAYLPTSIGHSGIVGSLTDPNSRARTHIHINTSPTRQHGELPEDGEDRRG